VKDLTKNSKPMWKWVSKAELKAEILKQTSSVKIVHVNMPEITPNVQKVMETPQY